VVPTLMDNPIRVLPEQLGTKPALPLFLLEVHHFDVPTQSSPTTQQFATFRAVVVEFWHFATVQAAVVEFWP